MTQLVLAPAAAPRASRRRGARPCACAAQRPAPAPAPASSRRRDTLVALLAPAAAAALQLAQAGAARAADGVPSILEQDLKEVEEVLGVQTLLLGLVAASALRVTGALGRGKRADANAPAAEYTKSGARRAAVNITPRPSAGGVLLEQLFAAEVNPDDSVSKVMTRSVLKARASDAVETVLSYFDRVTGICVVSDDAPEAVVGVFSRRDAAKATKKDPISVWMTTPALTIDADTRIVECAALMLKHEVHRLPVVDAGGALVGIITRTDVFNALLSKYKAGDEECAVPPSPNGSTSAK